MECFWCHNPEGRHPHRELQYFASRCIGCGACVTVCPERAHEILDGVHRFHRDRCAAHGACVDVCCSGALEMNGRSMSADEVMREVLADKPFYDNSGGGVTLSGGEPGLNAKFSAEILKRSRNAGIHTAIETCGYCSPDALNTLVPVTDLFMMDIKLVTPEKHASATGNDNRKILENARLLALTERPLIFRTPIVPGVNDSLSEFEGIVAVLRDLQALRRSRGNNAPITYELLAFHKLGSDKYASLNMEYRASHLNPPTKDEMNRLASVATAAGIDTRFR